jgi:uncharacterized hydrophobic protein (TIGR00341 family)
MRIVQIFVPMGMRQLVLEVLDNEMIDYAVWDETGRKGFEALVQFPISSLGVELILEKLRKAGLSENAYKIVLIPDAIVSSHTIALRRQYLGTRISREELISLAEDLEPDMPTFLAFIVVSTLIAAGGLLLDSAATIIGAMVVAPLMGPAISTSVGTVLYKRKLVSRGIEMQVIGLLVAIAVGFVVGMLLKNSIFLPPGLDIAKIPQMAERTNPTFMSLFLALGAGTAGALSVIRSQGSALVGVAIAIALIPPAAASGLGLAWGLPEVSIPAAVLVLVNLLSINVSALIMLWISGFRPVDVKASVSARTAVLTNVMFLVIILAFLSSAFVLATSASVKTDMIKKEVSNEMTALLADPEYKNINLSLSTVTVDYGASDLWLKKPIYISITINRRAYQQVPQDLASKAYERLTKATGKKIILRIGFVEIQTSP